jgi:Rod binding domain-containing protein
MEGIGPSSDLASALADVRLAANPPSALRHAPLDSVAGTDQKKQQIAKDFESILLTRLFAQVQQTMGCLDPEEEGTSRQVQGMFWMYLARDAADKGGIGLWKEIYQQLQQMDAVPNPADVLNEEL